jgi:hypothetical protein
MTPFSDLTCWVKDESVVFTLVAEENAALHRDVPLDTELKMEA